MIEAQPPHSGTVDSDEDMSGPTMSLAQVDESMSEHESAWEGRSRSSHVANDSSSLMSASDLYDDPNGLLPDPVHDRDFSGDEEDLPYAKRFQMELDGFFDTRPPSPAASVKSLPSPKKPRWTGPDGKSFDYDRASDSASLKSTPSPKKRKWEEVEDGEELGMYDNSEDEAADRREMEKEEASQHTPPPPAGSPPPPPPPQEPSSSSAQVEQLSTLLEGLQHSAAVKQVTDAPKPKGKLTVVPTPKLLSRMTDMSTAAQSEGKSMGPPAVKKSDAQGVKRSAPAESVPPTRVATPRPVKPDPAREAVPQKGSQQTPIEIDLTPPRPTKGKEGSATTKKAAGGKKKPAPLPVGPLPGFVALSEISGKGKKREELLPFPFAPRTAGPASVRQPSTLLTGGVPAPAGRGQPLTKKEVAKVDRAPNPHMPSHGLPLVTHPVDVLPRPAHPDPGAMPAHRSGTPVVVFTPVWLELGISNAILVACSAGAM